MAEERVIHHYRVTGEVVRHEVPAEARIIGAVARPGGGIAVYLEHFSGDRKLPMDVVFVGSGQPFQHFGLDHIATIVSDPFVWHVYGRIHRG